MAGDTLARKLAVGFVTVTGNLKLLEGQGWSPGPPQPGVLMSGAGGEETAITASEMARPGSLRGPSLGRTPCCFQQKSCEEQKVKKKKNFQRQRPKRQIPPFTHARPRHKTRR